jgi:hypothetical protein
MLALVAMEVAKCAYKEAGTLLAICLADSNQIASRTGIGGVGKRYDSH